MKDTFKNFNDILELIPEERKPVARALITELNFMKKTLASLKKDIKEHGAIEWFENGSQKMFREFPAMKVYSTLVSKYSQLNRQLCELIPEGDRPDPGSGKEDGGIYDFIDGE